MKLWRNARIATCDAEARTYVQGVLVTDGERIAWVGEERDLPEALEREIGERVDLHQRWVTPGLIDCHTHLVFAGTRAEELAARLKGESYEDIARRGGGILTTVRATRAAAESQLLEESAPRLESLLREGVTSVEIKSGYGLTLEDEAKMLRVARRLGALYPVTVRTTLLAAHAVPPEFTGRQDEYIDTVAREWLPRLHGDGLVDSVDVFCDRIAFTASQAERLFTAAARHRVPVRMHAEQLANIGGTRVAAKFRALSCDHLERTAADDVAAMAAAGTVAVLLPVAYHVLGETVKPPVAALRAAEVPMAVATDCNPGSAPGASLLLALGLASRTFGLTPRELLDGVTRNAARALGIEAARGTLAAGMAADFAAWDIESTEELGYWVAYNRCRMTVRAGLVTRHD